MTPWSVAFKIMLVTSQLESSSLYSIAVESLERLGDVAMGCGPILEAQSLNYLQPPSSNSIPSHSTALSRQARLHLAGSKNHVEASLIRMRMVVCRYPSTQWRGIGEDYGPLTTHTIPPLSL